MKKQVIQKVLFPTDLHIEPLMVPLSLVDKVKDKNPDYFREPAPNEDLQEFDFSNLTDTRELVRWLDSYGTKVKVKKAVENGERNAEIEEENRAFVRGIFLNFILREIVEDRKRIDELNAQVPVKDLSEDNPFEPFTYTYKTVDIDCATGEIADEKTEEKPAPAATKKITQAPLFDKVKVNPASILREVQVAKAEKPEKPVKKPEVQNVLPTVKPAKPPEVKPVNKPVNKTEVKPKLTTETPAMPNPEDFDLGVSW